MKSVVGEGLAVDCGSHMEKVSAPIIALLAVFARRGGAGTGRRPAWEVLAPFDIRMCILTKQPVAMSVSCDRGAVSMGSRWTSEVGGRQCLVYLSRHATLRVTVTGVAAYRLLEADGVSADGTPLYAGA